MSRLNRLRGQEPVFSIWQNEWPRDPRNNEFVFLARAVQEVGKFLFPLWNDTDPLSKGEGFKRYQEVQEWIASAIAMEKLPFVLITPRGSVRMAREKTQGYSEFGASDWNVADVAPLFRTCQMPGTRHRCPEYAPAPDWIYVERVALSRLMPAPNKRVAGLVSEAAVESWFLTEIVAPWRDNPIPELRGNVRVAGSLAMSRFPGLSKNRFEAIYKRLKPGEWPNGRPKKNDTIS